MSVEDFYDAELSAHHEHLRAAYGISPGDALVDIGCGTEVERLVPPCLGPKVAKLLLELRQCLRPG